VRLRQALQRGRLQLVAAHRHVRGLRLPQQTEVGSADQAVR